MSEEMMNITGWLDWTLYDENGNIKDQGSDHNQVQNQLKREMVAHFIKGTTLGGNSTTSYFTHMKLNTVAIPAVSTTSFAAGYLAGPWTVITGDGTAAGYVATYTATIPAGRDTGTIVTAGLFTTPTASGLRCAATIAVTKAAGDSLALTWTITQG